MAGLNNRVRTAVIVIATTSVSIGSAYAIRHQAQAPAKSPIQKETLITSHAKGTFEVKVVPVADDRAGDQSLGRLTIDKQIHGDLEATSVGQMLTATTAVKGSAGYVAMEKVTGTLQGRSGSFILQHSGTMAGGSQQLNITVVPDSGSGQLVGLTGKMNIIIADGKHSYDFEYALPDAN
jgi:hypothetical protein